MEANDLVHGHLDKQSWQDFVTRLEHDCKGKMAESHCTADAIFIVQARRRTIGIDAAYTDKFCLCDQEGTVWESPEDYYKCLDEYQQEEMDAACKEEHWCKFLDCDEKEAFALACEFDEELILTGWDDRWEYVNSHFTYAAAERFIKRKKHDYRLGLRIYVDAQSYCWEFNTIKEGILNGAITLIEQ